MASGTFNGATITPKNSSYSNRKWHCKLDYTTTDYPTYTAIKITVTFVTDYAGAWGQVGNYLRGDGTISGTKGINYTGASWVCRSGEDKVIGTYTKNITRTTSAQSISIQGRVWLTEASAYDNGTSTASGTVTVPALASYNVAYNANGGSGSVATQKKYYGQPLTLQKSGYTRKNYSLRGWNTAANGSGTAYSLGASYTNNAAATLYAQWKLEYTKPAITDLQVFRVASSSATSETDTGSYIRVVFKYTGGNLTDTGLIAPTCVIKITSGTTTTQVYNKALSTSGTFTQNFGTYDSNVPQTISIQLYDSNDSTGITTSIVAAAAKYPMDILSTGDAMGIMTTAIEGQPLTVPDIYVTGDIYLTINENAASGTTDGDLYSALSALGWI